MEALYLIEWPFAAVLIVALICGVVVYGIRKADKADQRNSSPQVRLVSDARRLTHSDED